MISTQELPHDGVGLLQGLGAVGGVKQEPIDDVDLPQVVLWERSVTVTDLNHQSST